MYKFVAKAHIHNMQTWYNEAIARSNDASDSDYEANTVEEGKTPNTATNRSGKNR